MNMLTHQAYWNKGDSAHMPQHSRARTHREMLGSVEPTADWRSQRSQLAQPRAPLEALRAALMQHAQLQTAWK